MSEEVHDAEVVDEPGTALEHAPPRRELARAVAGNTPEKIMSNAGTIAAALKDVLKSQGLTTNMRGNREHVDVGGWQAAGTMLGALGGEPLHAETVWSRRVVDPITGSPEVTRYSIFFKHNRQDAVAEVEGFSWEAKVEVKTPDGTVVGSAEAMCSRTESTWATRDDFALRSMAETRAESRAYRKAIGWIINMAGYSATPTEEMGGAAPNGPQADPRQAGDASAALQDLIGDNAIARQCLSNIEGACGGYLPAAVAGAIIEAATARQAVPPRATEDDFDSAAPVGAEQ